MTAAILPLYDYESKERNIRVFVSSTFRDMIEDRNELMSQVWPALRRMCRERAVEFVEVDLRWGVTEEQSQRKEAVRHCLEEIERCRPYFIGLLGERYGWMPGPESISQAQLREETWLETELAQSSVTELEILYGVLNDPDMAKRAFFYFRDPGYAQERGGKYLPESAAEAGRQKALKIKVKAVCKANHIPLHESYSDPLHLAALVFSDLTAAIDAEFPANQVPGVWAKEDRDHQVYAKSRCTQYYVTRNTYFDKLDSFALDGAGGCGLIVMGESGSGKSALLANWVERQRKLHPNDFVFQHYIGSSPISTVHLTLMRRLMEAIFRWCGTDRVQGYFGPDGDKIPVEAEEIIKVFPDFLDRLALKAKRLNVHAIIVIDALNQLEDRDHGRLLAWIPYRLPGQLRMVVSTLPGDTLNSLQTRDWPAITVEPLTKEERFQLIVRYLAHFAQGLSESRARKIASAAPASNPLYLKSLLDDLRVTGAHERLDMQIAGYLQAADIPALLERILARFERNYERDRPGLVCDTMSLLWASRMGLTESELLQLLGTEGEALPRAIWSPLYLAADDWFVTRSGLLTFFHDYLRQAIEKRYLGNRGQKQKIFLILANYFEKMELDIRKMDEFAWQLKHAESWERLKEWVANIEYLLKMMREERCYELVGYFQDLKHKFNMEKTYRAAIDEYEKTNRNEWQLGEVFNAVSVIMKESGEYDPAEKFLKKSLNMIEKVGPGHPYVADNLDRLANLLKERGKFNSAEPLVRRALDIREKTFGLSHPETAMSLSNLAAVLYQQGNLSQSELLMRKALSLSDRSLSHDSPERARILTSLGVILYDKGDMTGSEHFHRSALLASEKVCGYSHPETAVICSNLAITLIKQGKLDAAESLAYRALEVREKTFGLLHPATAASLSGIATVLYHQGNLSDAECGERMALEIRIKTLGPGHPDVALSLEKLAAILYQVGNATEAKILHQKALSIYLDVHGEEHPVTIRCAKLDYPTKTPDH